MEKEIEKKEDLKTRIEKEKEIKEEKTFYEKFIEVQNELKAPKNQYNNFGEFYYRNAEDILNAVKPLLLKRGMYIILNDELIVQDQENYIKATATVSDGKNEISTTAYAREALAKKTMDSMQITGSASSYARKYALNGLFAIDDVKDADFSNKKDEKETVKKQTAHPASDSQKKYINNLLKTDEEKIRFFKVKTIEEANLVLANLSATNANSAIKLLLKKEA